MKTTKHVLRNRKTGEFLCGYFRPDRYPGVFANARRFDRNHRYIASLFPPEMAGEVPDYEVHAVEVSLPAPEVQPTAPADDLSGHPRSDFS